MQFPYSSFAQVYRVENLDWIFLVELLLSFDALPCSYISVNKMIFFQITAALKKHTLSNLNCGF